MLCQGKMTCSWKPQRRAISEAEVFAVRIKSVASSESFNYCALIRCMGTSSATVKVEFKFRERIINEYWSMPDMKEASSLSIYTSKSII